VYGAGNVVAGGFNDTSIGWGALKYENPAMINCAKAAPAIIHVASLIAREYRSWDAAFSACILANTTCIFAASIEASTPVAMPRGKLPCAAGLAAVSPSVFNLAIPASISFVCSESMLTKIQHSERASLSHVYYCLY
jgi:hypothetical protein